MTAPRFGALFTREFAMKLVANPHYAPEAGGYGLSD